MNAILVAGENSGNGFITIELVAASAPEAAPGALFGLGIGPIWLGPCKGGGEFLINRNGAVKRK